MFDPFEEAEKAGVSGYLQVIFVYVYVYIYL